MVGQLPPFNHAVNSGHAVRHGHFPNGHQLKPISIVFATACVRATRPPRMRVLVELDHLNVVAARARRLLSRTKPGVRRTPAARCWCVQERSRGRHKAPPRIIVRGYWRSATTCACGAGYAGSQNRASTDPVNLRPLTEMRTCRRCGMSIPLGRPLHLCLR